MSYFDWDFIEDEDENEEGDQDALDFEDEWDE